MDSLIASSNTNLSFPSSETLIVASSYTIDSRHKNSLSLKNIELASTSENSIANQDSVPDLTITLTSNPTPLYRPGVIYPPSPSSLALPPSFDVQSWKPDSQIISGLKSPSSLSVPLDFDPRSPRLADQLINGIHSLYP